MFSTAGHPDLHDLVHRPLRLRFAGHSIHTEFLKDGGQLAFRSSLAEQNVTVLSNELAKITT